MTDTAEALADELGRIAGFLDRLDETNASIAADDIRAAIDSFTHLRASQSAAEPVALLRVTRIGEALIPEAFARYEAKRLPEGEYMLYTAPSPARELWLWRNGDHFLAFDNEFPCHPNGDPMTLGEPVGKAVFQVSERGQHIPDPSSKWPFPITSAPGAPGDVEKDLHAAICDAVGWMNQGENEKARALLRQTLVDYSDNAPRQKNHYQHGGPPMTMREIIESEGPPKGDVEKALERAKQVIDELIAIIAHTAKGSGDEDDVDFTGLFAPELRRAREVSQLLTTPHADSAGPGEQRESADPIGDLQRPAAVAKFGHGWERRSGERRTGIKNTSPAFELYGDTRYRTDRRKSQPKPSTAGDDRRKHPGSIWPGCGCENECVYCYSLRTGQPQP